MFVCSERVHFPYCFHLILSPIIDFFNLDQILIRSIREAVKRQSRKKSVIFKKFFPISCTNLQKILLNQRIVSSIYLKDLGSFFTLSMLKVYLVI